jgi:hypothetical protein
VFEFVIFRSASVVRRDIQQDFPKLANSKWYIKSPATRVYQCIAWAACRTDKVWWPMDCPRDQFPPEAYWPKHLPLGDESIENFANAFATIGYKRCDKSKFELGYQKVAIYALEINGIDITKHMARQHFYGRGWLSKLGDGEDIRHNELKDLDSAIYGRSVQILRRSWLDGFKYGLAWHMALCFLFYRLRHPSWIMSNLREKFKNVS